MLEEDSEISFIFTFSKSNVFTMNFLHCSFSLQYKWINTKAKSTSPSVGTISGGQF